MPRTSRKREQLKPLPTSILLMMQEIQVDMVETLDLCAKFDQGQNLPGQKIRTRLKMIVRKIEYLRQEIQRIRYYRDCLKIYKGKKEFLHAREFKEARYGPINKVAEFQISQKN